jgi:hypothetical protein
MEYFIPAIIVLAVLLSPKIFSWIAESIEAKQDAEREQRDLIKRQADAIRELKEKNQNLSQEKENALVAQRTELEKKFRSCSSSSIPAYEYEKKIELLQNEIKKLNSTLDVLRAFNKDDAYAYSIIQEKEALAQKVAKLEAELKAEKEKKSSNSPALENNDEKKHSKRISELESKLARIKSFCPDFDKLLHGQISPSEYELVLIDKIPTYTIAGEVNNTPLTNFPINREPTVSHPPATFSWDRSVRALYVNGKRQHRLDNALSEEIEKRFLSPVKIEIGKDTLSASVLIDPSTKREKESGPYTTTLSGCKCYDFEHTLKRNAACKHMFALALHLNLITENGDFVDYIPF